MATNSNKKDRVKNTRRKTGKSFNLLVVGAVVLAAGAGMYIAVRAFSGAGRSVGPVGPVVDVPAFSRSVGSQPKPAAIVHREILPSQIREGRIVLAAADFSDGAAKYYRAKVSGKEVKFFVLESSDGVIRAAFDACDVCYQAKRGYRQEGDFMICNNCGQRFVSTKVNELKGGCNPSPLERVVQGDELMIDLAALAGGLYLF